MSYKKEFGKSGEELAKQFLLRKGLEYLDRNVRNEFGEIDLVFKEDDILVFVEVKTRSSLIMGQPEDSVTLKKQQHIIRTANAYLQQHEELNDSWRVVVISILKNTSTDTFEIEWFIDAIK